MKKQILIIMLVFMSLFDCFAQIDAPIKKEEFIKFFTLKQPTFDPFDFNYLLDIETKTMFGTYDKYEIKYKKEHESEYLSKDEKILNTGKDFYQEKKYTSAFVCFKKASDLGNKEAKYLLALCYLCGKGTEKNIDKAIQIGMESQYDKAAIIDLYLLKQNKWNMKIKNGFKGNKETEIYYAETAANAKNVLA